MSDKDPILDSSEFDLDFQDFSNTVNSIPDNVPTIPTTQFSDHFQPGNWLAQAYSH